MRVMFLGLRGFPNVQGGVETHAENLCPILVQLGCTVEVIVRSPYQPADVGNTWKNVRFYRIWSPKIKSLEAFVHSLFGVLYAGMINRPDILHIQAIGPALVVPLARLMALKVIVTHHGPDYDRQKWGKFARKILQLGELFGMRFSHARIVISKVIRNIVSEKYSQKSTLIPNGVVLPAIHTTKNALVKFGLQSGKYILLVSRLVQEKRHHDLIQAFKDSNLTEWKLVLVGSSDHPDDYTTSLLGFVAGEENIICTGFQSGRNLAELYSHAGIFVLPSSHEGLPIALLEALSYGLYVLASNIPANLEVGLPDNHYFPVGNVAALTEKIKKACDTPLSFKEREEMRQEVAKKYDWYKVAEMTLDVYRSICSGEDLND